MRQACSIFRNTFGVHRLTAMGMSVAMLAVVMSGCAVQEETSLNTYRFDCGTHISPVKAGWTQVLHDTLYSPEQGYGWLGKTTMGIDRGGPFLGDLIRAATDARPERDDMECDYVLGKKDMTFRADVPNGEYWVLFTIGDEGRTRRNMSVWINGELVADNVTTTAAWGGSATYKTFRKRIQISEGKIEFAYKHKADGSCAMGMELVPYVPYPVSFKDGKWQSDNFDANLQKGLDLLNQGKWQEAREACRKIAAPLTKATALACVADLLDIPEPDARATVQEASQIVEQVLTQDSLKPRAGALANELERIINLYLKSRYFLNLSGYSRAIHETGFVFPRRMDMAAVWFEEFNEVDPLYNRACLNLGRIYFGFATEGHKAYMATAEKRFGILKERQPNNRLVRIYNGEQIPWGEEFAAGSQGMPEWAVKQREAMGRLSTVLHWWIENRQLDNGELGGGMSDDVEMLRSWHVYLAGPDDPIVRLGWQKIAHGVWFGPGFRGLGYSEGAGDVQHSAESMSDTHPVMIGLDYGNPLWVERCMATMRLMRDRWTGINARGHRHFKSMSFGAVERSHGEEYAVDLPCNCRATRPGLWLGWYQKNPEVIRLFTEWMDAWVEDIMREENGKPAGIVPASISYKEDRIGGNSDTWWWDENLYWTYFKYPGYVELLYDHLMAVYDWTGDEKYLKPVEFALDKALEIQRGLKEGKHMEEAKEGSREWAMRTLYGRVGQRTAPKYRILTGNTKYDEYLKENGPAYIQFLITGDKSKLVDGCEAAAAKSRNNFELKTTEVLWTDRIFVWQGPMWGMYTGGAPVPYQYPSHAVTWTNSGPHFAALVMKADRKSLKVLVCNFEEKTKQVGMNIWRLEPGTYEFKMGPDSDQDDTMDSISQQRTIEVLERGTIEQLQVPARSLQVVQIAQVSKKDIGDWTDRVDLAIGDQDVHVGTSAGEVNMFQDWLRPGHKAKVKKIRNLPVTVVVHNIGRKPTDAGIARLFEKRDGQWVEVTKAEILPLEAPNDLQPRKTFVVLRWSPARTGDYDLKVTIETESQQPEITMRNNSFVTQAEVVAD